jgi:hypothetical protein
MQFRRNKPQGTALQNFIARLTSTGRPVRGVTLATTKAAPDAGAQLRIDAVVAALKDAGKDSTTAARLVAQALTAEDRDALHNLTIPIDANNFDEVIFLELA